MSFLDYRLRQIFFMQFYKDWQLVIVPVSKDCCIRSDPSNQFVQNPSMVSIHRFCKDAAPYIISYPGFLGKQQIG